MPGDPDRITAAFGPTLFLRLSRSDRLAQAISRVKAEQSGLWHRNADGSEYERLSPHRRPVYDRAAIAGAITEAAAQETGWDNWFARENPPALRLDYDRLAADPRAVLSGILAALGLDPGAAEGVDIPTARLADATNRDWAARFRRETGQAE